MGLILPPRSTPCCQPGFPTKNEVEQPSGLPPPWSMPTRAQAWMELGGRGQGCSSGGVKYKEPLLPSDLTCHWSAFDHAVLLG